MYVFLNTIIAVAAAANAAATVTSSISMSASKVSIKDVRHLKQQVILNYIRDIRTSENLDIKFTDTEMICAEAAFLFLTLTTLAGIRATYSTTLEVKPINSSPTAAPLGCHRRLYTYRVTQADVLGRECWDYVSVMSCWGRCDSSEISDWKFPYKRSFHPVCVHAERQSAVAILRNCHPEAADEARRYEYMEAVRCHCHTCSTLDTSCEAPENNIDENTTGTVISLTGSDSEGLEY